MYRTLKERVQHLGLQQEGAFPSLTPEQDTVRELGSELKEGRSMGRELWLLVESHYPTLQKRDREQILRPLYPPVL